MGGFWHFFGLANRNDIENLRLQEEANEQKLKMIQVTTDTLISSIATLNSTLAQTMEQEIHKTKMEQQVAYSGISEQLQSLSAGLASLYKQNDIDKTEYQSKHTEIDEKVSSIRAILSTLKDEAALGKNREIATAKMYKNMFQDLSQANFRQEELLRILIANSLADALQEQTNKI